MKKTTPAPAPEEPVDDGGKTPPELPPPDVGADVGDPPDPEDADDDFDEEPDAGAGGRPKSESEVRRAYEEGPHAPGTPDTTRVVGRPLNMKPVRAALDSRMTEGPVGMGGTEEIDNLALALQDYGSNTRYCVVRTFPAEVPAVEVGPFAWQMIHGKPNADRIREAVAARFGGGSYDIVVSDRNDGELQNKKTININVGGDPIMQSLIGRLWYERHIGKITGMPPPTVGPDGRELAQGSMSGGSNDVLIQMLQLNAAADERKAAAMENEKNRDNSLAAAVIQSMANNRPQPAINGTTLLALLPIAMQFMKDMRDDRRDREDRLEKRMAEMHKPQSAMDVMTQIQPMFALMQKRAELEMGDYSKRSQQLFDHALSQLKEQGRSEEDIGFLATMGKEIAAKSGDILTTMLPMLTAALSGGNVAQMAQMMGGQPGVDPRLAAARGPQALPPGPRPMAPRPVRPVAPPPAPAAGTGVAGGKPEPEIRTNPPQAETTAPPGETIPAPGGTPAASGETLPAEAPPAPTRPPPGSAMAQISQTALQRWLFWTRESAFSTPDPVDIWDAIFDGQLIRVMFGLAPVLFRQRVQTTDIEKDFSVESWVEGGDAELIEFAREFDGFLQANATARAWLVEYLDAGPWVEDDDEEDPA